MFIMKVLYVVYNYNNEFADFYGAQVENENEKEYITIDRIKIGEYKHNFPKDKLNVEFEDGYVTDVLDKQKIKEQLDRIHQRLTKLHLENAENPSYKDNGSNYKYVLERLEKLMTPEEYEKSGQKEKNEKEFKEFLEKMSFLS